MNKQAFIRGFFEKCSEYGLTIKESEYLIKKSIDGSTLAALLGAGGGAISGGLYGGLGEDGNIRDALLYGGLGAGLGGGLGYGTALGTSSLVDYGKKEILDLVSQAGKETLGQIEGSSDKIIKGIEGIPGEW